jgi:hypothetical protein
MVFYHTLTLASIAFANVLFRADTVTTAIRIWSGMIGLGGFTVDPAFFPFATRGLIAMLVAGAAIVAFAPNTQQIMGRYRPAINWPTWASVAPAILSWRWKPTPLGFAFAGLVFFFGVEFVQRGQAVFLYFNF